jgi:hypothetical protein
MAPAQDNNQEREPKAFLSDDMDGWREILDDARWAPSPHNTQPWLVRLLSPEAAELYAPRERLLPVEDPEGRFETAAQGIFLEALDVAAGKLGLTVETEPLFPSPWCLSSRSGPRARAEALSAQHARHSDRRLDRGIMEHTGGVPRSRADAAPFLARAHRARALSPALRLRHHQPHLPRSPGRATPGQRSRA